MGCPGYVLFGFCPVRVMSGSGYVLSRLWTSGLWVSGLWETGLCPGTKILPHLDMHFCSFIIEKVMLIFLKSDIS